MTTAKKKILFLTRSIAPPWNEGTKNFVCRMLPFFDLNRFDIQIISPPKSELNISKKIKRIPLFIEPETEIGPVAKIKMLKILLATDAQIVHCLFSYTFLTSLAIKIVSLFKKYKIIQTITSLNLKNKYLIRLSHYGHLTVCFSKTTASFLKSAGITNLYLIPPGVDVDTFQPRAKKKIIAIMGELHRLRSFNLAEKITKLALNNFPDYQIWAAFRITAKYESEEKNLVNRLNHSFRQEKRISFKFSRDINNIAKFLNQVKLIIYPAVFTKGKFDFPLVSIEALACGTPVLFSPVSPYTEAANYSGFYIAHKNRPGNFIDKAKEILGHDYRKISANARKSALKYFDIKKIAKEYQKIYANL